MAKLTITVDAETLKRQAAQRFVALSKRMSGNSRGATWTRDELWTEGFC